MTATVESGPTGLELVNAPGALRPPSAPRSKGRLLGVLGPLVIFAAFIGFWYLVHYVLMSEHRKFLVPPPHVVVQKSFLTWKLAGNGTLAGIAGGGLHDQLEGLWLSMRVALL